MTFSQSLSGPCQPGRPAQAAGFTLIEIMIVVLVISITLGIVGVNLTRDDRDRVKEEADRLAMVLSAARDESILQGRVVIAEFRRDGYRFLRIGIDGRPQPIEGDDTLTPRRLPDGMTLSAEIDGAPNITGESLLILDPTGTLPNLVVTLRLGERHWLAKSVHGQHMRSINPESARAG
jgi:general secretion pathway protein H